MLACAVFSLALCTLNITGNIPMVAKPLQRLITASSNHMFTAQANRYLSDLSLATDNYVEVDMSVDLVDVPTGTQLQHKEDVDVYGRTPLLQATGQGDVERVRTLLASGAEVNAVDAEGRTPLMIIAGWGRMESAQHLRITELLLEHGADVNARDNHGHTPLMAAAKWGRIETAKILLQHGSEAQASLLARPWQKVLEDPSAKRSGADVNATCDYQRTPLMLAARSGHLEVVELLLQHDADINAADTSGYTALMFAMWRGHLQVAALLLQHKADINAVSADGSSVLIQLITKLHKYEIVRMLVEHHVTIDDLNDLRGQPEDPLELMSQAVNFKNRSTDIEFLLQHRAEVNASDNHGRTPLLRAVYAENLDIATILLEYGAKVNVGNRYVETPLLRAVYAENLDIATILLEYGAKVNVVDRYGETPLMFAVKRNNFDLVELLLEHDAKVNAADNYGDTPLMMAAALNNTNLVKLLLKYGANINATDNAGMTVLMKRIAYNSSIAILRCLLDHGAEFNDTHRAVIKNKFGATELAKAEAIIRKIQAD